MQPYHNILLTYYYILKELNNISFNVTLNNRTRCNHRESILHCAI